MSAVLYYGLGKPIVSDAQFDEWCKRIAKNWNKLDRYRQWQFGSPEEIKASAFHVKVSWASAHGTHSWLTSTGVKERFQISYTRPPRRSKRFGVDWWTPEDFIYTILEDKDVTGPKRRNKKTTGRPDTSGLNRPMQQGKPSAGRVRLEAESNVERTTKRKRPKGIRGLNKLFRS